MSIRPGGYVCDKCSVVIIEPDDGRLIYRAISNLLQNTNLIIRIYCPRCGDIVKRAEHTMRLENSEYNKGVLNGT